MSRTPYAGGTGTGLPRDMQDAIEKAVAAKFAATQQQHKPDAPGVTQSLAVDLCSSSHAQTQHLHKGPAIQGRHVAALTAAP